MNEFTVVAIAPASAVFAPGKRLRINVNYADVGNIQVEYFTRYRDLGHEAPIPICLGAEVKGVASDFRSALNKFTHAARVMAPGLAFASNAFVGIFECNLAFDSTPGLTERQYFQSFLPEHLVHAIPTRRFAREPTSALITSLNNHTETERMRRALTQYRMSLRYWRPDPEDRLLALSHLFMAAEALKVAILRNHMTQNNKSREEVAEAWGIVDERENLESECRRRLIFDGDSDCHRYASEASNVFEHGYKDYEEVYAHAEQYVVKTAKLIRASILNLSGLEQAHIDNLITAPYDQPRGPMDIKKYVWGKIVGEADQLASKGSSYPHYEGRTEIEKVQVGQDGVIEGWTPKETLTARIADKVSFQTNRWEMWDGSLIVEMDKNSPE